MDRAFTQFGGPGGRRPFRPFPHPFFPGRFLLPFFFFSPFIFPFFREGENANDHFVAQHQAQGGETLEHVAHMYNIPAVMLEEANPHIANPQLLNVGESVFIPRISHMPCHKTYMENSMPNANVAPQPFPSQNMKFPGS